MRTFFKRLSQVYARIAQPIPEWGGIWEKIVTPLIIVAPSVVSVNNKIMSLRTGLLGSAALLVLAVIVAAYRLQKELDELRESSPKLIVKRFTHRDAAIHDRSGKVYGTPTFYHAAVVNQPSGLIDRKTAEKVAGRMVILSALNKPLCEERLHRWAHAPSQVEAGKSADLMQAMDIPPNGIEYLLDVVMKYDSDEEFYTTNNDTGATHQDFRDDTFKFGKGEYLADIYLAGNNIVTTIKCRIVNLGKGKKLHMELLTK